MELTKREIDEPKKNEEVYMTAMENLVYLLEAASPDEIRAEKMDQALEESLILDQRLFPLYCKTLAERVSLMSSLAAYQLSLREGLPKHSPVYMGWATALKKRIETYYGTKVRNYS